MRKFVNALGIIFLFILIFGIIGKSLDFDELDKNDDPNSDDPIVNPGDIIGPGTDTPVVESRIAVPTSEYVNNIYFNNELTNEEIMDIMISVDYAHLDADTYVCPFFVSSDNSFMLSFVRVGDENFVYSIIYAEFTSTVEIVLFNSLSGWSENFDFIYNVNDFNNLMLVKDVYNFKIYNDEIKKLVYTYPSELVKEEVSTLGTPVPNSGNVENVYLNTNLSVDEVVSVLDLLEYTTVIDEHTNSCDVMLNSKISLSISIWSSNGEYLIVDELNNYVYFHNVTNEEVISVWSIDFSSGWNPSISSIIEVKDDLLPEYFEDGFSLSNIGSQNNKLASLISTTPFN